jgi:hypothetical protein
MDYRQFGRSSGKRGDGLLVALIKARVQAADEEADHLAASQGEIAEQFFMTRLRARIRERREQLEGGFWENTVLAARGWLLAFGLVASLFLAPSVVTLILPTSQQAPPSLASAETGLEVLALSPHDASGNAALAAGGSAALTALESIGTLPAKEVQHGR